MLGEYNSKQLIHFGHRFKALGVPKAHLYLYIDHDDNDLDLDGHNDDDDDDNDDIGDDEYGNVMAGVLFRGSFQGVLSGDTFQVVFSGVLFRGCRLCSLTGSS